MWDSILHILEEKVKEGVEVRVMYDDFGCMFKLPQGYEKTLINKGIKTQVFNPFNTILSPRFNNRDHRKICVIDGIIGFTGGINLADEYINETHRLGYWKDSAVMLRGRAVWSLAVQFLTIWNLSAKSQDTFEKYTPSLTPFDSVPDDGIVQPYSDIPMDSELVGETVYLNLINRAKRFVYITTPYLIVDNETLTALENAAKSGVDVRIITPHIPDKKIVFFMTRSYYKSLIDAGVKIYEYTPGFMHAKTLVSDGKYAVVGTINFDFRSLYLHLECAVWMYESRAVKEVTDDFYFTLSKCQKITAHDVNKGRFPLLKQFALSLLRVFAPLM